METVKVVDKNESNKRGWKIINKSDLTELDILFDENESSKQKQRGVKSGKSKG